MSELLKNAIGDRGRQHFQIVDPDQWLWEDCVMDDMENALLTEEADRILLGEPGEHFIHHAEDWM